MRNIYIFCLLICITQVQASIQIRPLCEFCRESEYDFLGLASEAYYRSYPGPIPSREASELLSYVVVATTMFTTSETSPPRKDIYHVLREVNSYRQFVPRLRVLVFYVHQYAFNVLSKHFPSLKLEGHKVDIVGNPELFSMSYKEHFKAFYDLPRHLQPTTFIFLEEDMELSVDALVSWANDNVYLEPLGILRSFYRLLLDPRDGCQLISDETHRQSAEKTFTLNFQEPDQNHQIVSPRVHKKYIELRSGYCAMFAASRNQLLRYIEHPTWNATSHRWGIRETASSGIQWAFDKVYVPLCDTVKPVLSIFGSVEHHHRLIGGSRNSMKKDGGIDLIWGGFDSICFNKLFESPQVTSPILLYFFLFFLFCGVMYLFVF